MNKFLNKITCGDCLELMKELPENCIDTVITDPPYGLKFMGKKWDYEIPSVKAFSEMLRVAKSGATLLCFGGTRTWHRIAVNIEDAGWEIVDTLMWLYGSGFPKALDISKVIDKRNGRLEEDFKKLGSYLKEKRGSKSQKEISKHFLSRTGGLTGCVSNWELGYNVPTKEQWILLKNLLNLDNRFDELIERIEAERKVIGRPKGYCEGRKGHNWCGVPAQWETTPTIKEAKLWSGWKSHALKPAYEPIIMARKPNDGSYVNNALTHGVAGLNIDECRINIDKNEPNKRANKVGDKSSFAFGHKTKYDKMEWLGNEGRYPANLILDEEAGKLLDEQSGNRKTGVVTPNNIIRTHKSTYGKPNQKCNQESYGGGEGGASRFFYCAKSSKGERNKGLEGIEAIKTNDGRKKDIDNPYQRGITLRNNHHPTVKPLELMEYLCKLTKTPTGGTVLDPYGGTGSTLIAAKKVGRDFIGFEIDMGYCEIARARLKYWSLTRIKRETIDFNEQVKKKAKSKKLKEWF